MRIISGRVRGRRLTAPKGLATRPTTERVREAWFSMLGPIEGQVADLYAGTGALGFEAISRGAEHVVFVESARAACRAIRDNSQRLDVSDQVTLLSTPIENAAATIRARGPYDLILTDPPWTHMSQAENALRQLLRADLLSEGGVLVLGHPKGRVVELPRSGLRAFRERSWGDSGATFWCRDSDGGSL